ncbi:MAG: penicillin-binding protein activator [Bdellovibrio sp.]|nr:MAG: penicillin-binding protein activator [Bdellovibrio sp.]
MKSFITLVFLLFFSSCTTFQRKRPPQASPPNLKLLMNSIEIDLAAGAEEKALFQLNQIISKYKDYDIADDAYIMKGDIYFKRRNYQKAYKSYIAVVQSEFSSPRITYAMLRAAQSLYFLGRQEESLSLVNRALKADPLPKTSYQLHLLKYKILSQIGDSLPTLKELIYLSQNAPSKEEQSHFKLKSFSFVKTQLSPEEIDIVAHQREFSFLRAVALFKIGEKAFEERDYDEAYENFEQVTELSQNSKLIEQAKDYLKQINARKQVNPRTIGAILPLSGRYAKVGYRALHGLQLGLGLFNSPPSGFNLAVIDSEGNPDVARRAVEKLIVENHVIAIVGSLLSKTSVAVASKANELGVPTIALSQKSGLTDIGEYVFRNALTSSAQVKYLVHYVMDQLHLSRFAILYPNDSYGVEYANLFWDAVLSKGGQITAAQPYNPKERDFRGYVQRLVGTFYLEDRQDEYKLRFKELLLKEKKLKIRRRKDSILPPIVDFEAIFIPDSTKASAQIAAMLAVQDVKGVRLLGTNLWNSPSLLKRGGQYVEGALFVDSFLENDSSFKNSNFYRLFHQIFQLEPGIFESQAYDAGLILRQLISEGYRTRSDIKQALFKLKNFKGSTGTLFTLPNREIQRPLISLVVEEGKIKKVKQ